METERRIKLVKLLKELSKEERDDLYSILQNAHSSHIKSASSKYPAEKTEIQYNGALVDK